MFEDATHPFWALRIYYLLTLLSAFDNASVLCPQSRNDKVRLEKVLINLESDYRNNLSYSSEAEDLNYYIINHSEGDFKKLMDEFAEVLPIL